MSTPDQTGLDAFETERDTDDEDAPVATASVGADEDVEASGETSDTADHVTTSDQSLEERQASLIDTAEESLTSVSSDGITNLPDKKFLSRRRLNTKQKTGLNTLVMHLISKSKMRVLPSTRLSTRIWLVSEPA